MIGEEVAEAEVRHIVHRKPKRTICFWLLRLPRIQIRLIDEHLNVLVYKTNHTQIGQPRQAVQNIARSFL